MALRHTPATLLGLAEGAQMRAPETRRTQSDAPIAVGERPPPPLLIVTAIEMELCGVTSSRSSCLAATAPNRSRKVRSRACRCSSSRIQPSAPNPSSVAKRSRIGATDARPGYVAPTLATSGLPNSVAQEAMTAPPTGTRKFLSVDWMKASRRPCREAELIAFMH